WKRGAEACAQRVGPVRPQLSPSARAAAAADASFCQQSLGLAMWDLLLEARQVKRVVEVQLAMNHRSGFSGISTSTWLLEPGGGGRVAPVEDVSPDRVAATVLKALGDLLAGSWTKVLPLRHPLPSLGSPALEAAELGPPK